MVEELRAIVAGKVAALPAPLGETLANDAAQVISDRAVDLPARFRAIADEIVGEPKEHVVILSPGGLELLRRIGEKDRVELTAHELLLLPDNIMVHNHTGVPQSFSEDDVRLAVWHSMAGMHAVDDLLRYQCVFHSKLDSDSTANWTAIPQQTGQ